MAARDYKNHNEYGLDFEDGIIALGYVETLKDMMLAHGFKQSVVDLIEFDVRECSLILGPEDIARGASHAFDGGDCFYEISLSTGRGLLEAATHRAIPLKLRAEADQAVHLCSELALNCFNNIDRMAGQFNKAGRGRDGGALTSAIEIAAEGPFTASIGTRRTLEDFFQIACDIFQQRLDTIAPRQALPKAANINTPKL